LRASLVPAVAVTPAQGAYTYVVALRGLSVGCLKGGKQLLTGWGLLLPRVSVVGQPERPSRKPPLKEISPRAQQPK